MVEVRFGLASGLGLLLGLGLWLESTLPKAPKLNQPNSIVETCFSFCRSCIRPAWKTVKNVTFIMYLTYLNI